MDRISKQKKLVLSYFLSFKSKQAIFFQSEIKLKLVISRLVITGSIGSGKSSLLKVIAGILTPQKCKVIFDGITFVDSQKKIKLPLNLRKIGYLWQESTLFPHLTIQQNIFFSKTAATHPQQDYWLDLFQLKSLLSKIPSQVSGGEKQKICLLQALLSQPQLLLLDEPLSSLDKKNKHSILDLILQINSDLKIPMIYVTHSETEQKIFAEQTLQMEAGKII